MSTRNAPHAPAQSPRVRVLSIVVGLLLVGLAVIAARDAFIHFRAPTGWEPILPGLPEKLTGLSPMWAGILGVAAVIIGLIFLVASVKPRSQRFRRLPHTDASIWARPVDIARFTTSAAKRQPGVLSASTLVRRDQVTIDATVLEGGEYIRERLTNDLRAEVTEAFGPDLEVTVTTREEDQP